MSIPNTMWHGKPYYSLDAFCKNTFGEKLYKIAIDAGFSCPGRDGRAGKKGCIFCSQGGSGEFAVALRDKQADISQTIAEQIETGKALFHDKKTGSRYIAYFQAYTNTYGPVSYLEKVYRMALDTPSIAGISIATRPDCLGQDVLNLLAQLKNEYPNQFIWVELGLQTKHEHTATLIRRGYPLPIFEEAVHHLADLNIPVIVHTILGLPGETKEDMLDTIAYLNTQPIHGLKLQLLHVLRHTDLADMYENGAFQALSENEYLDILICCLEQLSPDIVVHRVTGDGPKEQLIAPLWSLNKRHVLNSLHKKMKEQNSFQGKRGIL